MNYLMNKISCFWVLWISVVACSLNSNDSYVSHERLVDFSSNTVWTMTELTGFDEQTWKALGSKEFNSETDTLLFEEGEIYISYLSLVNGCAQYAGNLDIADDTINLKLVNIADVACTELRCDRLKFVIENIANKSYVIVKW